MAEAFKSQGIDVVRDAIKPTLFAKIPKGAKLVLNYPNKAKEMLVEAMFNSIAEDYVEPILLSVCIPTVVGREKDFEALHTWVQSKKQPWFEVIVDKDNKEVSIGAKRQRMLDAVKGKYFVMLDDDDAQPDDYFDLLYPALLSDVDCIGYKEHCHINGKDQTSIFSIAFPRWASKDSEPHLTAGYDHVRTPFYKSPIKTEIARQVGFADMRESEDHEFAKAIYPLLDSEYFIKKVMYYYQPVVKMGENRYGK